MEIIVEIGKFVLALIAGGGIHYFINFRSKRRRDQTALAMEEYKDADETMSLMTKRTMKLSDDLMRANKEYLELRTMFDELNYDHNKLQGQVNIFKESCTCGAAVKSFI